MANPYLIFNNNDNGFVKAIINLAGIDTQELQSNQEPINLISLMNLAGNNYEDYTYFLSDYFLSGKYYSSSQQTIDINGESIPLAFCSSTMGSNYYGEQFEITYLCNTVDWNSNAPFFVDVYEIPCEIFGIIKNKIYNPIYTAYDYNTNTTVNYQLKPLLGSVGTNVQINGEYLGIIACIEPNECLGFTFLSDNNSYNGILCSTSGLILPKDNWTRNN